MEKRYQNQVQNTLNKVVMIDLVERINKIATHEDTSPEADVLREKLTATGIAAYSLRGSGGLHNFINKSLPYPRNSTDMDLVLIGNEHFAEDVAQKRTKDLFAYAASLIGGRVEQVNPPMLKHLGFLGREAQSTWCYHNVEVSFAPERLEEILANPLHYRLKGKDVETIRGWIDANQTVTATLPIEVRSLGSRPDLPLMDYSGREVDTFSGPFHGVLLQNFLEQAIERIRGFNSPERNNLVYALDLQNCLTLCGNDGHTFTPDQQKIIKEHLLRPGSTQSVFDRWALLCHGWKKCDWEGKREQLEENMQSLVDCNLYARTYDGLDAVWDAAKENSAILKSLKGKSSRDVAA